MPKNRTPQREFEHFVHDIHLLLDENEGTGWSCTYTVNKDGQPQFTITASGISVTNVLHTALDLGWQAHCELRKGQRLLPNWGDASIQYHDD